jgi:hypothetical protein
MFFRPIIKGSQNSIAFMFSHKVYEKCTKPIAHIATFNIEFISVTSHPISDDHHARPTDQPHQLQSRKDELSESIPASTTAFTADETVLRALSARSSIHQSISVFRFPLSAIQRSRCEGGPDLQFEQPTVQRHF